MNNVSIDFREIGSDEDWEFFARDYLAKMGLVIELDPGRGHDHGKDLIVAEQMNGRIRTQKFTWLVSCKHFATSNRSIGVSDEQNILDRVRQHSAHGFLGFYSTIASSSMIDRLKELVRNGSLHGFEIIDRGKIEAKFHREGLSELAIRYFPESYKRIRPVQAIWSQYEPLVCEICDIDILKDSVLRPYGANVVYAKRLRREGDQEEAPISTKKIQGVYVVCKKDCDRELRQRLRARDYITDWMDVSDLCNPILFMKSVMAYMNRTRSNDDPVSDEAHEKIKRIYLIIAQRVLREIMDEDRKRVTDISMLDGF